MLPLISLKLDEFPPEKDEPGMGGSSDRLDFFLVDIRSGSKAGSSGGKLERLPEEPSPGGCMICSGLGRDPGASVAPDETPSTGSGFSMGRGSACWFRWEASSRSSCGGAAGCALPRGASSLGAARTTSPSSGPSDAHSIRTLLLLLLPLRSSPAAASGRSAPQGTRLTGLLCRKQQWRS